LEISTIVTIADKLNDGWIRVEHSLRIVRDGEPARLVTFAAMVESTRLTSGATPKGTAVFGSPREQGNEGTKPATSAQETKLLRLKLSDLREFKPGTRALAEEPGDCRSQAGSRGTS
jgi:hypothetical protein